MRNADSKIMYFFVGPKKNCRRHYQNCFDFCNVFRCARHRDDNNEGPSIADFDIALRRMSCCACVLLSPWVCHYIHCISVLRAIYGQVSPHTQSAQVRCREQVLSKCVWNCAQSCSVCGQAKIVGGLREWGPNTKCRPWKCRLTNRDLRKILN